MHLGRTAWNSSSMDACGCVRRNISIIKQPMAEWKWDVSSVNIFQSDQGWQWHESVRHGEKAKMSKHCEFISSSHGKLTLRLWNPSSKWLQVFNEICDGATQLLHVWTGARQCFQAILGWNSGGTDQPCGRSRCLTLLRMKCHLAKTTEIGAQMLSRCRFSVSCQESRTKCAPLTD